MSRNTRTASSTGIYHVMIRGVDRQQIFKSDDDCIVFLSMLKACRNREDFKLLAYCLMGNHVHLLLKEGPDGISKAMHRLETRYAQWFNKKYDRVGCLFQSRFKSEPVEDDAYLLMVIKYIHFNPVKAGLCESPGDYCCSSYRSLRAASPADPEDFFEDVDFRELFGIIEKEKLLEHCDSFLPSDEIICVDTPEDRKLMVSEDTLYKFASIDETEFQVKETTEKQALVSMLYTKGLSIRRIGKITNLSATYISKLLWAE